MFTKEELAEIRKADAEIESESNKYEQVLAYRRKHPEKVAVWSRNYYAKHRDKIIAYQHEYYKKNRGMVLERQRAYYQAHKMKETER